MQPVICEQLSVAIAVLIVANVTLLAMSCRHRAVANAVNSVFTLHTNSHIIIKLYQCYEFYNTWGNSS